MATEASSSSLYYEPKPQWAHCGTLVEGRLVNYGGRFGDGVAAGPLTSVDIFNPTNEIWEQKSITGTPPSDPFGAACASIGQFLYHFGGEKDGDGKIRHTTIHRLDIRSRVWTKLIPVNPEAAPMLSYGMAVISCGKILILFGGYGVLPPDCQPGVQHIPDPKKEDVGWTNEVVCYDTEQNTWFRPNITGSSPPACRFCSLTRVNHYQAVMFGGKGEDLVSPDVYILDVLNWTWNVIPTSQSHNHPAARAAHSAVSLYDPDSDPAHPAVLVMWGVSGSEILTDSWVFHLNQKQWRKVILPEVLKGRAYHISSITHSSSKTRIVCFGGLTRPEDHNIINAVPIAQTTIVELFCSNGNPAEWTVTDVIRTSQLGQVHHTLDEKQNPQALLEIPKEGYTCVARNSLCLVYLPKDITKDVLIEAVKDVAFHPKTRANEILLTPVVRITPHRATFTPAKPAIIELIKTVHLVNNESIAFVPLFSISNPAKSPEWKEMGKCQVLENRIEFRSTRFGLFTAVARLPFPSASISVVAGDQTQSELTIPELPQFKVIIPPSSVCSDTEIKATVYYDNPLMCEDEDTLATACITLEPHGIQFAEKVPITMPVPNYDEIKKTHPDAKLQLWHSPTGPEGYPQMKWALVEDPDLQISDNTTSDCTATFYTSHFCSFKMLWKRAIDLTPKLEKLSHFFRMRNVMSILSRCQVFMSQEAKVESLINFSIAALVYPFSQHAYSFIENYSYILYDSGDKPIEFKIGNLHCDLQLKDYQSHSESIANCPKSYTESATFSGESSTRIEFDVNVDSSAVLICGIVIGRLSVTHGDDQTYKCNLIKPLERSQREFKEAETSSACVAMPTIMLSSSICNTKQLEEDDLHEVLETLWDARNKWYNIGIALKINPYKLETIKSNNHNIDECFRNMLLEWLRRFDPIPCWKNLAEALRSPTVGVHVEEKSIAICNGGTESTHMDTSLIYSDSVMHTHTEESAKVITFQDAVQQLDKKMNKWKDNPLVESARRVSNLVLRMDPCTTNFKGGNESVEEKFNTEFSALARSIDTESKEFRRMVMNFSESCRNEKSKKAVFQVVDKIPDIANQLKILAKLETSKQKNGTIDPVADCERSEALTANAMNLISAISEVFSETEAASIHVPTTAKRELGIDFLKH